MPSKSPLHCIDDRAGHPAKVLNINNKVFKARMTAGLQDLCIHMHLLTFR